jgi:hypothetical protein
MSETGLRRLAAVAIGLVAAIAAVVSYSHIFHLALALGQTRVAAYLLPLSVDGRIGAASAALLAAARRKSAKTPRMAQAMLAAGVLATLAANAYSGMGHGVAGMALAMWPGIAFIGSSEVGLRMVRQSADDKAAVAKAAERAAKPVTRTAAANRKIKRARTLLTAEPAMATADLARKLGVTPATARRYRDLAAEAA